MGTARLLMNTGERLNEASVEAACLLRLVKSPDRRDVKRLIRTIESAQLQLDYLATELAADEPAANNCTYCGAPPHLQNVTTGGVPGCPDCGSELSEFVSVPSCSLHEEEDIKW